jgi:sugar phosphate isomerase/epimerase
MKKIVRGFLILTLPALCFGMALANQNGSDITLRGGNILSCETYSVRQLIKDGKLTLETAPALYKSLGIKGMALNDLYFKSWDDAYLDKIKAIAKQEGRIITALILTTNLAQDDEAKRRTTIDLIKTRLRAAQRLGAPVVRIDLGRTGRGDDADDTIGVERVIAAFKEFLPLAKEFKVKMTIENHGGVSRRADNILRIIKGTDPKWVGSCLDFGNWPDDVRYEECQKLAPYAYHTHAKSYKFNEQGEETKIDYKRVLGMLKAAKYKGALSIEFEGAGDPVEGVRKTRDLLAKYW